MKSIRIFYATIIVVCTLLTACKKNDWKSPIVNCRILETIDRTIAYNAWGDPKSATFKVDPDATGNPTFYFVYNAQRRLIGYGGGSDHHLTYNSKGQAVIDTLIMNYAGQDDRYEQHLYYDNFGRIIKVVEKQYYTGYPDPDVPSVFEEKTTLYKYDSRGNLIIPGVSYDNKTSLYRTNAVWMLVHRNYSVNNPAGPTTYNSQGLPHTFYGDFLERGGGGYPYTNFVYSCDENKGKY